jgi:CRISPR system Cascade subunit CasE
MVQLKLRQRELFALGKGIGLPMRNVDLNYLVHCALGELFQDNAPRPFSVESADGRNQSVRVLAYSDVPMESLRELARSFASPMLWECCDWELAASKPMPEVFPAGLRLGFETRVCPVVRKSQSGKELDVFLDRVIEVDDESVEIDRGEVYNDWLRAYVDRRGGAQVESSKMTRFSLERVVRRTHGANRKARTFKRPAATIEGVVQVTEPAAFGALVRSGIGRHKSFGFGMLKLQRAS